MKITLQPESCEEVIADASRKAIRAYAREIKNKYPEESQKLFERVKHLDAADVVSRKRNQTRSTSQNIEFTKALILGTLQGYTATIEDIHYVLESSGYEKYQTYLWVALKTLTNEGKVKLTEQKYKIIET